MVHTFYFIFNKFPVALIFKILIIKFFLNDFLSILFNLAKYDMKQTFLNFEKLNCCLIEYTNTMDFS